MKRLFLAVSLFIVASAAMAADYRCEAVVYNLYIQGSTVREEMPPFMPNQFDVNSSTVLVKDVNFFIYESMLGEQEMLSFNVKRLDPNQDPNKPLPLVQLISLATRPKKGQLSQAEFRLTDGYSVRATCRGL